MAHRQVSYLQGWTLKGSRADRQPLLDQSPAKKLKSMALSGVMSTPMGLYLLQSSPTSWLGARLLVRHLLVLLNLDWLRLSLLPARI